MEIIDWTREDSKNSLLGHYIIEAMSKVGKGDLKEFGDFSAADLSVEMRINGVQVPFVFFFELLEKHFTDYEKELEETAAEKVIERKIHEIKGKITDGLAAAFGLDPWEFK